MGFVCLVDYWEKKIVFFGVFDLHVLNLFIFWLPVAPLEYSFLKRLLSSANLRPMGGGTTAEDRSEIALFKVKKKFPFQGENSILEFTSILVCPKKLVELRNYPPRLVQCNMFAKIADDVYDILEG